MSDDIFYDDYGNGIDDEGAKIFSSEEEARIFAAQRGGTICERYDDYGDIEYVVHYRIN